MKLLALETSTGYCTVALRIDGDTRYREELAGQRHSERVLPMADELLKEAGLRVKDLDAIAFGAGPGSFTGLRIACGCAQGLAFGAGLPVVPVGTLEALAEAAAAPRVAACLDARMSQVYFAAFERSGADWTPLIEPGLCDASSAPLLAGGGWIGCGSGFEHYADALKQRLGASLSGIRTGLFPHAREVAALGVRRFEAGRSVAPEDAAPVYIRDKVALKMSEQG